MIINDFPPPFNIKQNEVWLDKIPSWSHFENLCLALAEAEFKIENIRKFGTKGQFQEGIDIYWYDVEEKKYLTIQCKKVNVFSAQKIKDAVKEFLGGMFKDNCKKFILCASDDLHKTEERQKALIEVEKELGDLGIAFEAWDYIGLNQRLKKHIKITGDFFGANWVLEIAGPEAHEEYLRNYKPFVPKPSKIYYPSVENYIPRTVSSLKGYEEKNSINDPKRKSLNKLIERREKSINKYIVLSQGGDGKSLELSYLSNYFSSQDLSFFPIRIELRNYIGEEIDKVVSRNCVNWNAINENELILLFDGLDEVGVKEYEEFIKRINIFSKDHQDIIIIISSRTNYFNTNNGDNLFNDFEIVILNDLTHCEIDHFIETKLGLQKSEFKSLIEKNNFDSLLHSPFYLVFIIDIFIDTRATNKFPKSKSEILSRILEIQFEKANIKFPYHNLNARKKTVEKLLKLAAFSMTCLAKNYLTENELQILVPDTNDRSLFSLTLLDYVDKKYQFSHNLIQEYLTGLCLNELTFTQIKDLVSFRPFFSKVKNKWLNALSFLLSVLPKKDIRLNEITDWLVEYEPEVLILMEANKFAQEFRFETTIKIIEKYKSKGIHIPYYYFQNKNLAEFAGFTKSLLQYCLNEFKKDDSPFETKLVCIRLIKKFDNYFALENVVKDALEKIAINDEAYPHLQEEAIRTIAPLAKYINVENSFDTILEKCNNINNRDVRRGLYALIEELPFRDEYVEFAIEGIEIINKNNRGIVAGEEMSTERIFLKSQKPQIVKKVLQVFINDKTLLEDISSKSISFSKEFVGKLIVNASKAYAEDESIFHDIIALMEAIGYEYSHEKYSSIINPFFDQTNTTQKAFDFFYEKGKATTSNYWDKVEKLVYFSTEENLKNIYADYENKLVSKEYIFSCRNLLGFVGKKDLHDWFYAYINKKSNSKFLYTIEFDWQKHKNNQHIYNQELLLDKKLFIQEVGKVFKYFEKTSLTKKDLWDYKESFKQDAEMMNNTLAVPLLRDWAESLKEIDLQTILKKYSDEKRWQSYIINEIVRMVSGNKEVNIHLKHNAIKYLNENLLFNDLKYAVTDSFDNRISTTYFSLQLNLFCKEWDLDFPDNVLLDILYTDCCSVHQYEQEDYKKRPSNYVIRKITNTDLIKERVLQNLKDVHLTKDVLGSHFYLCKKLRITEAKTYLYRELENTRFSEFTKEKVLEIYLYLGGEIYDLLEMFLTYSSKDYWYWLMADKLIDACPGKIIIEMIKILKNEKVENKIEASLRLLRKGKIEAVQFFCDYVRIKNISPYDYHFLNGVDEDAPFPSSESLELLFQILIIPFSTEKDVTDRDPFDKLDGAILSFISRVALQSDEAYLYTVKKYDHFIKENILTYPKVKNLHNTLMALENQYFKNREEIITINEVKIIGETLGIIK